MLFLVQFFVDFSLYLRIGSAHKRTIFNITKKIGTQLFSKRQIRGMHIFIVLIISVVYNAVVETILQKASTDIPANSTRGFQGQVKCSAGKDSYFISPAEGKYCSPI